MKISPKSRTAKLKMSFGFILSLNSCSPALHKFLDLIFGGHGRVAGSCHGERAVRSAVVHSFLGIAAGHEAIDQPAGKAIATADTVENLQIWILARFVELAVHVTDGRPVVDGG